MFRDDEVSSSPRVAGFNFPVKSLLPEDMLQDWEQGGVALNDPSMGLNYQLWHFTLEIDEDTGHGSVFVQAPNSAKIPLIDGADITEISGAFDQNMNPFVAYIQDGEAKFWWYDSTLASMTHTTLPSGSFDLRCTLDDKRDFNVSDSDIILAYVRDGTLYFRKQRDRYLVEYVLFDEGSIGRLVSMAMNSVWCLQWRLRGSAPGSEYAVGFTEPLLGDVIYDFCRDAGLLPQEINVSELYNPATDIVPGIKISVDEGMDKPIGWLQEMYPFDKVAKDKKLYFPKRGRPVVMRIPYKHLIDARPQALKQKLKDPEKLPKLININHIDSTGGFAKNKQTASRRSNLITSTEKKTIDAQVVQTPDQAASAALRRLKIHHNELYSYEFKTTIRYSELTPTDVVEVEDEKGVWHRMRITQRDEDRGQIKWQADQDAGSLAYDVSQFGNTLSPPVTTTPGLVGDTILEILNEPVQVDQDDELGLYIAARGTTSGWQGYALFYSIDAGVTYNEAYTATSSSNIGETITDITDIGTAVEVLMPYPLESVTPTQIAAGFNRAIIGDEEVQYQTATLLGMVGLEYHYSLTGLVRGVLRTDKEPWSAGIRFVQLDASVLFLQIQREFYGMDIYYKAVSLGQSIDEVTPVAYLFDHALSQTEWPVTDVEVTAASGGGVTVTWNGSPRLGTFGPSPFHSKYLVGYQVKFSDGHIIETTEETVTYSAGLMGTVVEVRARNAITGLGPLADGEGAVDPGDISVFGFSGSFPDMYEGQSVFMWNGDNGISMSGGLHEAYARGFVVPGVGARAPGRGAKLDETTFCGIPFAAGTYTSLVQLQATSPDPIGSGISNINQSVTVLPTPSHGLLDLEFREYQMHKTTLINTTPPWKKFQINGGGTSLWFYGVTTGKVAGQFIIDGAAALSVLVGINNMHGKLTISGPTNAGVGEFADCAVLVGDGTYSMELDADTGDWWLYKDVAGTPTLVANGNVPLTGDHQYRICMSNPNDQVFDMEFNGGNEAWFMTVTQAGHGGIPVPARGIPIAWAYCEPDYILSFNGSGEVGAILADDYAGGPSSLVKANAEYSTGRHRFKVSGAYSAGICVAAFDIGDGVLGSPGTPNSAGVDNSTLRWSWGGGGSAVLTPLDAGHLTPILALDADSNTLKVVFEQTYGDPVVVYTLPIPAGETWQIGAWVTTGTVINGKLPGPVGYADAIVP